MSDRSRLELPLIAVASLVLALNLVVFGLHVLVPLRLAVAAEDGSKRAWSLAAPAALLTAVLVTALAIAYRPDDAIATVLTFPIRDSIPARLIAVVLSALALVDCGTVFAWRRLEPAAWRVVALFGLLGVAAHAFGSELLRIGWGPGGSATRIVLAALLRLPLALAAAELVLGRPRWFCPLAAPSLLAAAWIWPGEAKQALGSDLLTLLAAVALLASARFVSPVLRRLTGTAGLLLAILFLARSAEMSRVLGGTETAPQF